MVMATEMEVRLRWREVLDCWVGVELGLLL